MVLRLVVVSVVVALMLVVYVILVVLVVVLVLVLVLLSLLSVLLLILGVGDVCAGGVVVCSIRAMFASVGGCGGYDGVVFGGGTVIDGCVGVRGVAVFVCVARRECGVGAVVVCSVAAGVVVGCAGVVFVVVGRVYVGVGGVYGDVVTGVGGVGGGYAVVVDVGSCVVMYGVVFVC